MQTQTLKFKLYKNRRNKHLIQQIDIAGIIWNHCIALHRRYYRLTGKYINKYALMKHIAKLKKQARFAYWRKVGSQAIQAVVERVDRSYQRFFKRQPGEKVGRPSFKKVKKYSSFTLKQAGWKLIGSNRIRIQGKVYKFSKSRNIIGQIKTVTVKRDRVGDLWLFFVVKNDVEVPNTSGNVAVGFDFGLKTYLTASDGEQIESPQFFRQGQNELAKAQRAMSRKKKGSVGWYRAKKQVAKVQRRIADRRKDWFFKLAHDLCGRYDLMFFEDLSLRGMKSLWGRKVSDLGFYSFLRTLEWVATKRGKQVRYVDRYFASSKTCHDCGHKNTELSLSDRQWVCPGCGVIHDRDANAALNIRTEGLRCFGVEDVRPTIESAVLA